jgi:hypothetical protein
MYSKMLAVKDGQVHHVMNLSVQLLVLMVNALHRIHAHVILAMLVKHVNILKVCFVCIISFFFNSKLNWFLDDPRLVQCFRKSDCSATSSISNASMSIPYCCGNQAGVATANANGSCALCSASDEEIANATSKIHRTVDSATCVLWGPDHFRTFDGLTYDFDGV